MADSNAAHRKPRKKLCPDLDQCGCIVYMYRTKCYATSLQYEHRLTASTKKQVLGQNKTD